jgi:hypothetical protein
MEATRISKRETVIGTIAELDQDTFWGNDLLELFPDNMTRSGVSAIVCTLVKEGLLFRTGNRRPGKNFNGTAVEYTRCASMAWDADRTASRGHAPAVQTNQKDLQKYGDISRLTSKVNKLTERNSALSAENSALSAENSDLSVKNSDLSAETEKLIGLIKHYTAVAHILLDERNHLRELMAKVPPKVLVQLLLDTKKEE